MILFRVLSFWLGYICGIVEFGYLFGKTQNIDIRSHGSGNIGTTNTLRVLGPGFGGLTLICDCMKAVVPALIVYFFLRGQYGEGELSVLMLYAGFGAVIGHDFPVVLRFKGGKGIATSLGLMLISFPETIPLCLLAFIVIVAITRYVSLGSITCAILFPLQVIVFTLTGLFGYGDASYKPERMIIAAIAGALAIWLHRSNIKRLVSGNENKFSFGSKA